MDPNYANLWNQMYSLSQHPSNSTSGMSLLEQAGRYKCMMILNNHFPVHFNSLLLQIKKRGEFVYLLFHCYPTALKVCRGIVFTHGVRMDGWVGLRREKVFPSIYCPLPPDTDFFYM